MALEDVLSTLNIPASEVIEKVPVFLYLYDLTQQKNIFSSKYASSAVGYSESDLPLFGSELLEKLIHPDDLPALLNTIHVHQTSSVPETSKSQFRVMHKDKGWRVFCSFDRVFSYSEEGAPETLIGVAFDITESKQYEQHLEDSENRLKTLSQTDPLTGLPNRLLLLDRLQNAIFSSKRRETALAVLFFDIDNFKHINDTYGHKVGDQVLLAFVKRILEVVREDDTLARLGGDEFVLVCQNLENERDIHVIVQKILNQFNQMIDIENLSFLVTSSIGVSFYPNDSNSAEDLIKNADIAMYHAKKSGKNDYQLYSKEMTQAIMKRLELERQLVEAIENKQFEVYYQPQVNIHSGEIVGLEALIRWNHPEKGLITPDAFIPLAEELRLIIPIGEFVFKKACQNIRELQRLNLFNGTLALNVSGVQIEKSDFVQMAKDALEEEGLDAKFIELEITESVIMDDEKSWIGVLTTLKEIGFKVAIDDFGKGYSSLTHLVNLPVDKIKIDRAFVEEIAETSAARSITEIVMYLAQKMEMTAFAEGVEKEVQKDILKSIGCDFVQGYYFSKPKSFEEIKDILASGYSYQF